MMTEPVRHRPPKPPPPRRACATIVALSLAVLTPISVHAAPSPESQPQPPEGPSEAEVRAALDDGDLTTARELATARSEAQPSAANLTLEAEVWLALGDYEHAREAYEAARDKLPAGDEARATIDAQLERIQAASRGTKADEPASEQRERLDRERAERLAALAPKPPPPPEIIDKPAPVRIIKKWYFWVTLGAIVASAGAIVGIAASSAVEDAKDNGNASAGARRPIPVGGVMFRF